MEELIAAGRVSVNGSTARLGQRVNPSKDKVEVDGSRVPLDLDLVHYLLNKPPGVVTTASDPEGRPTVLDLVDVPARVWPAGRLDVDSEGALILTNDGELSYRLTHPSFEVPKTYVVEIGGGIGDRTLRSLARGVELEDGRTRPAKVGVLERNGGLTLVEITISEGRNRQVRRMFDAVGHRVLRLVRTSIGPLKLGHLKPGSVRKLAPGEVRSLYRSTGL
ncbi:MAG: rRNA pseudouridine synthase [Actinomycetota bacterium]|nr:rRNA pseudouridine synthase [Actinomycetota bacterium]